MVTLSIENLREIERLLKNAQRAVRAATYSASGSIEPLYSNFLTTIGTSKDIADIRTVINGSSSNLDAAKNVVNTISDYIV
jgi:hypothetical protein